MWCFSRGTLRLKKLECFHVGSDLLLFISNMEAQFVKKKKKREQKNLKDNMQYMFLFLSLNFITLVYLFLLRISKKSCGHQHWPLCTELCMSL